MRKARPYAYIVAANNKWDSVCRLSSLRQRMRALEKLAALDLTTPGLSIFS
jgi:hypothetical protein